MKRERLITRARVQKKKNVPVIITGTVTQAHNESASPARVRLDSLINKQVKRERLSIKHKIKAKGRLRIGDVLEDYCVICGRMIGGRKVNIGGVYRHFDCYPGSPDWMKSDVGRRSHYRRYFESISKLRPPRKSKQMFADVKFVRVSVDDKDTDKKITTVRRMRRKQ